MTVLSLCDLTGNMVRPWAEEGHQCVCVDLQHSIRNDRHEGNIRYTWGDARSYVPDFKPSIIFAFPPCTDLAVSGARDYSRKGLRLLIEALQVVESCRMLCELSGVPWMLENPVGVLSTYWRKPDAYFHPWEYDIDGTELYTKKTCIWHGGGFVMPKPLRTVKPENTDDRIHKAPPSDDRADFRSATPRGFAKAVQQENERVMA